MLYVRRAVETSGVLFAFQVGSWMSLWAFFQERVSAWHLYGKALVALKFCHCSPDREGYFFFIRMVLLPLSTLAPVLFLLCFCPSWRPQVLQICAVMHWWVLESQLEILTFRTAYRSYTFSTERRRQNPVYGSFSFTNCCWWANYCKSDLLWGVVRRIIWSTHLSASGTDSIGWNHISHSV